MNHYLLAWNPAKWNWKDFNDAKKVVDEGGDYKILWRVANRSVKVGDHVYIIKLGKDPKGIFASGEALSEPVFIAEKNGDGIKRWYIEILLNHLLDPEKNSILLIEHLKSTIPFGWSTQSSGIIIPDSKAITLDEEWSKIIEAKSKRGPKWTRDELILALDLYFKCPPLKTNASHPDIIRLSEILNSLPIHPSKGEHDKFRNPNGVYMKLCNFLRLDPNYHGEGLKAGGKLEEDIWNEFSPDREKLHNLAVSIIENGSDISEADVADNDYEFEEGRILTKVHRFRERDLSLTKKKKQTVLSETGELRCEACGMDYKEKYGDVGDGFCECHHNKPVALLKKGEKTKLKDLSIICANCHRMIHRTKPLMSVKDFQSLIKATA